MELNTIFKGSVACALALMISHTSLSADYLSSSCKPIQAQKHSNMKHISSQKYAALCDDIFEMHSLYWSALIMEQDYFNQFKESQRIQEKQKIKKLLKGLARVITESKKRVGDLHYKRLKGKNEKVYYSSLALKHLLEILIDDTFMEVTGGVDFPKDKIDILAYGRGVEKAQEFLKEMA